MRIVIVGATGMIGSGALLECLDDPRVTSVLAVGRSATGVRHPRVTDVVHADLFNCEPLQPQFAGCDACFFCLGVSAAGLNEATYRHLTYDLTLAVAQAMLPVCPALTFCYVSGQGTDTSERGRIMWARVKGATENALLRLPFKDAYLLRPGFVQPLRGVRSRTALYRAFYTALGPLNAVIPRLLPSFATTTVKLGRALIRVAKGGDPKKILTNADINRLGDAA